MSMIGKKMIWLIFVALTAAFLAGCGGEEQKAEVKARGVPVITQPATARQVEDILRQVGTLDSAMRSTMRARVDSSVVHLSFQEGARVKKGDVLVRLDDAKILAAIDNLQAGIKQLGVKLAFQQKTLERNRQLLKRSAIAQHQFDSLESDFHQTELAITQAKADLARQREMLADTVISAPFDGVVGARTIAVGDYLKTGDKVVTVVGLDPLEVGFNVPERYKPKLALGHKVHVQVAAEGDRLFDGEIFFIAPIVDPATRSFQVKARVGNRDGRLNPGMFANVRLVADVRPQAVTIPWTAVIVTEEGSYAYVVENGKAKKVVLNLGQVTHDWAEVLDGAIKPGDELIVEGKFAARDGAPVVIKNQGQEKTSPAGQAKQGA
ncbi:efflux transporter, RND family, MFP subunit [Desulfarculus baarsii DSM 2075]|uniref:Efflux transporter, RND family, MFP subunit n=1 Tax=Desulfarculus baarsii (strain ATCC 33931 / DSM 2075 / LMG 7858 / VKM B-1802 / 2st14) TaxID=644282 RepID=E1QEK9_DESB2|nr:efflux RND transporter periplasmic adaptor subunit [Desulfarculus baarsii]ADK83995.1 efflux transporter, RND family, MFP subunit [Desulfarculus baarsii DSM 2075]